MGYYFFLIFITFKILFLTLSMQFNIHGREKKKREKLGEKIYSFPGSKTIALLLIQKTNSK